MKGHIAPQCPQRKSKVNHVVPEDPSSNTTQSAPPPSAAPVQNVNGSERNARDAQLRTDLASMLSRLQQQHVQSVSVSPLFRSVCGSEAAPAAPEAAAPEEELIDIEVFILDADGTVIDRPDEYYRLATPNDFEYCFCNQDSDHNCVNCGKCGHCCEGECRNYTRWEPDDFETRSAFYDWLLNCTCGCDDGSCFDCYLCQGCCTCPHNARLPGTVAGGWGCKGDAHIGEASHPGPPKQWLPAVFSPSLTVSLLYVLTTMVAVLSICDGMGCAALSLQNCNMTIDRYVAVEIDNKSKLIAQFANPKTATFPGIDHSVCSDIFEVTEQHIIDIGTINLFIGATPCGDFSKLRLLPSSRKGVRFKKTNKDPRPGLNGPNGKKFRRLMLIMSWVLKHNPNCEYFIENLMFDDMPTDWDEVCSVFGVPLQVNSMDYSYTKRNRAYWHNFKQSIQLPPPNDPPLSPDRCMNPGRTLQTYTAYGIQCVRPIGGSWTGDPDNPVADTGRPVLVNDELYDADQHLVPNEAERLHGLPVNCTAAPGATNLDRLKAIGHGWDVIVTSMLLAHSSLEVHTHATHDEPQHMQQLLIHAMDHLGPQAVADVLTELPDAVAQECLGHLVSHYVFNIDGDYSVLDSGSARHLNNTAFMLDPENRSALTGFDGLVSWTNGSGYLPVDLHDEWTGESLSVDITDVDIMSSDLVSNILSLGKLLRSGFEFHLTNGGKECYAVSPGGAARIKIILGSDDILRIQHQARTGAKAIRLPTAPVKHTTQSAGLTPVMALARSAGMYDAATSCFFHDILNHCGDEKAYRTLGVTKSYKQTRLKPYYCKTCAASKARNFGLSRKHPPPAPVMPAYEDAQYNDTFDDMSSSDDESGDELDMDTFTAETAGRELGIQPVQRYDLSQLKLWEIMYGGSSGGKKLLCVTWGGWVDFPGIRVTFVT